MAEEGRGEGFLSRWSRLKRGEALPEPAAPPVAPPVPEALPEKVPEVVAAPAPEPEPEPEPEIDLSSLPRVEEITAATDISGFLRKGVPAALRNAALRRAWSADPVIRDFIGPADYAWDWNVPGGVPGYAANIASGPDVDALADRILGLVKRETDPARDGEDGGEPATAATEADAPPEAEPRHAAVEPAPRVEAPSAGVAPAISAPPRPDDAPPTPPARPRHGGAVPT
jgi:hypothetical protein